MSAEQTPDIERVLAEHVQIRDVSGVVLCMCGEWIAYMAGGSPGDDDRHHAHVAQALAPVLAAAVREAAPSARRIYEAIDWDFVEVFRGEDEPGYPTPEAFCEHLANALAGGRP